MTALCLLGMAVVFGCGWAFRGDWDEWRAVEDAHEAKLKGLGS